MQRNSENRDEISFESFFWIKIILQTFIHRNLCTWASEKRSLKGDPKADYFWCKQSRCRDVVCRRTAPNTTSSRRISMVLRVLVRHQRRANSFSRGFCRSNASYMHKFNTNASLICFTGVVYTTEASKHTIGDERLTMVQKQMSEK